MTLHADLPVADLHVVGYRQATDPGAIGADRLWIDTSGGTGNWVVKVRNAANTGWELVSGATVALASSTVSGKVKTDVDDADPVVYLASSTDTLLAALDAAKDDVGKLTESSGPTTMAIGAVADGEYLKRSGATIIGGTPAGGGGTPSFIGYNTIGGSTEATTGNRVFMKKVTLANPGTLVSVEAYMAGTFGGATLFTTVAGVLSDNAGVPKRILASGASRFIRVKSNDPRWIANPVGIYLPAGDYWLAYGAGGPDSSQFYYDVGTDNYIGAAGSYLEDVENGVINTLVVSARKYSIRALFLPD